MKNTFKLMGLALLAGTLMFTACKKDDNNDNPPAPAQTFSVNFDGHMCPMAFVEAYTDKECEYFMVAGATDTVSLSNFTLMTAFDDLDTKEKWSKNDVALEYSTSIDKITFIEEGDEIDMFGEFLNEEVTDFSYTDFDATKLTLTTNATAIMASFYEFYNYGTPLEECTRANMTVTASNIPMLMDDSKMSAKATIAKKVALKK